MNTKQSNVSNVIFKKNFSDSYANMPHKRGKKRRRNNVNVYGEAPKPMRTDQLPLCRDVGLQVNIVNIRDKAI